MGKRRNAAKTGDKNLIKSIVRAQQSEPSKDVDDDDMYNEVDRYNNARDDFQEDMLRFGKNNNDSDEEGMQNDVENVFDLGLDQSDEEDSSSSDDDSDSSEGKPRSMRVPQSSDDDGSEIDEDSSIEGLEDLPKTDVLDWGKRKRDYYHGDTADLEIGQEVEDAELEEEAGKEVLKARLDGMTEGDYMLDDDDSDEDKTDAINETTEGIETMSGGTFSSKRRKLSKLAKKEKIKLLSKNHPEMIPLISHFRDEVIKPCAEETSTVVDALLQNDENAEAVGATALGLKYLLTKAMVQTSSALNICQYLLIKADQATSSANNDGVDNAIGDQETDHIKNHPVISRLNQLNRLSEKLDDRVESKVKGLKTQLENLVKASALMTNGDHGGGVDSDTEEDESDEAVQADKRDSDILDEVDARNNVDVTSDKHDYDDSTESSSDDEEEQAVTQRRVMNEARFALRKQDDNEDIIKGTSVKSEIKRRRRALPSFSDFGDEEDSNDAELTAAGRSLASTINKISQRSKSGKKSLAPEVNDEDDEDRFKKGLAMMEAEFGGGDDDDDNFGDGGDGDNDMDNSSIVGDDEDDFYAQIKKKSKAKKEFKKSLYAVAPKYPGMDDEIEGERAVGQMIMKNRGLVAHKSKLNRNPRVKKREQYRKALIKRKGAVREVRTEEGHKYGGEDTGIKSGLSRSRKLGVR